MKTYVITLSKRFPTGHNRAGEPTLFGKNSLKAEITTRAFTEIFGKLRFQKSTRYVRTTHFGRNVSPRLNGVRLAYQSGNGRVNLIAANRLKLPG